MYVEQVYLIFLEIRANPDEMLKKHLEIVLAETPNPVVVVIMVFKVVVVVVVVP